MRAFKEGGNSQLGLGGDSRGGEHLEFGYVLKVELVGCTDTLDMGVTEKDKSRLTPWFFT